MIAQSAQPQVAQKPAKKKSATKNAKVRRLNSAKQQDAEVVSLLRGTNSVGPLKIGRKDDIFEKEADSVADQVVRNLHANKHDSALNNNQQTGRQKTDTNSQVSSSTSNSISPTTTTVNVQRVCKQCEEEVQLKGEDKSDEDSATEYDLAGAERLYKEITQLRNGGKPLDQKGQFESQMGHDFSQVRIHNSPASHDLANRLGAKAFTFGNNIVFGAGRFTPQSMEGRHLLAHELTHVIQQGSAKPLDNSERVVANTDAAPQLQADLADDAGALWNSGVNLVADTASYVGNAALDGASAVGRGVMRGASAVGRGVVRGAQYVGEVAVDAYENVRDYILDYLREYAPDLLSFLQGDIVGTIKEKIISGLDYLFNGFGTRIQEEGLVGALTGVFGELTETVRTIATDLAAGNCDSLFSAMQSIAGFGERLMGPAFDELRAMFSMVSSFFGDVWSDYGKPFWEAIKGLAGSAWTELTEKATWLWNQTAGIRSLAGGIWQEFKNLFNIAWNGAGGVLTWIKEKAQSAWNEIKEFLGPALLPLQILGSVLLLFTPMGPIVAIGVGIPLLWQAASWVINNWDSIDVVVRAREILSTQIVPALQSGLAMLQGLLQGAAAWLSGMANAIASAVTNALQAIGAMPLLRALAALVGKIGNAIKAVVTWIGKVLVRLFNSVKELAAAALRILQPLGVLLFAIVMFPVNPWILTIVLAGWAWRILPDCFKPPIIDFWLNVAVTFVSAMPDFEMFGPAWPQAKAKIIEALQNLLAMDTDAKITGANKIAKMMTGEDFTWIANLARAAWNMPSHFMGKVQEELVGQDLNKPLPIERLPEDALDADSGQSIDDAAALLGKDTMSDNDVVVDQVANTQWEPELIDQLDIPDGGEVSIPGGMPQEIASPQGVLNEVAEQDGIDTGTGMTQAPTQGQQIPQDPEEQLEYIANQPTEIDCNQKEKKAEPATAQEVPAFARQYGPFTPMQRLRYTLSQMGKGISKWFDCNKHWLVPTLIVAIVALIVLIVVTEGAILGVLASIMEIIAAVMIGVSLVRMTAWIGKYVSFGIAGKLVQSSAALAKGLAIGAIELIFALLFSLGPIVKSARSGFKAARATGKGVTRSLGAGAREGARETGRAAKSAFTPSFQATRNVGAAVKNSAAGIGRSARRVGGAVIRGGKLVVNGVRNGFAAGIRSIRGLRRSISRLRFNGFSMTRRGRWFALWGHFNPKALLASGEVVKATTPASKKGEYKRGLAITTETGEKGIVIGVNDKTASKFLKSVEDMPLNERKALFEELENMEDLKKRATFIGGTSETAANAKQLRSNMLDNKGAPIRSGRGTPGGGNAAHHIVPSTHTFAAAEEARDLLKQFGIKDINNEVNGVFVPPDIHNSLHTHNYMTEVANRLRPTLALLEVGKNATPAEIAAAKALAKADAISTLDDIASEILAKTFPP